MERLGHGTGRMVNGEMAHGIAACGAGKGKDKGKGKTAL